MNKYKTLLSLGLTFSLAAFACDNNDSDTQGNSTTSAAGGESSQTTPGSSSAATTSASDTSTNSTASVVELRLIDNIDETRGYCLDISGGKGEGASVDKGLQAHTCYDYTGGLLVDQSFDAALISGGEFKIPHFDVCMTASGLEAGASLQLAACEKKETQLFTLNANGNLTIQAKPELCVTVSSTEKKEGKGGSPVHVMRPVSLQPCSADNSQYQSWKTFSL